MSDEPNPTPEPGSSAGPEGESSPNAEAARRRLQLREVEAERDQLRARLDATHRALVGQQAVTITCVGLAGGLTAAFFLSQSLASLIYGISTRDAISFLVVPLVLIVVSLAACAAPAWRATRIDPLVALRTE